MGFKFVSVKFTEEITVNYPFPLLKSPEVAFALAPVLTSRKNIFLLIKK